MIKVVLDKDTEVELTVCRYFGIEPIRIGHYPYSLFNDMIAYMEKVINENKIKDFQQKAQGQLRGRHG